MKQNPNGSLPLKKEKTGMRLRAGTSGYSYKEWVGKFYPEKLPASAMLCVAETDEAGAPLVSTSNCGYLRLRRTEYTDAGLKAWAERIAAQPWKEVSLYFKHEDEAKGPRFARRFLEFWRTLHKSN
jgi:uncharacterized protein YecE (DUF72 family)